MRCQGRLSVRMQRMQHDLLDLAQALLGMGGLCVFEKFAGHAR